MLICLYVSSFCPNVSLFFFYSFSAFLIFLLIDQIYLFYVSIYLSTYFFFFKSNSSFSSSPILFHPTVYFLPPFFIHLRISPLPLKKVFFWSINGG